MSEIRAKLLVELTIKSVFEKANIQKIALDVDYQNIATKTEKSFDFADDDNLEEMDW